MNLNLEDFLNNNNEEYKGVNFKLGGEVANILMSSLIEILKQSGGQEFITLTLVDISGNKYAVTVENCNAGLSPEEKIAELVEKNAQLEALLSEKNHEISVLASEKDHLTKSISSLSVIEKQLKELDKKREMLENLKAINLHELINK